MLHHPSRSLVAVATAAVLVLAAGCSTAGGSPADAAAPPDPAGHHTRIELHVPGGTMVTEVRRSGDRSAARSWAEYDDGSEAGRVELFEEVHIGTDHWVRLPAVEREGIIDPAWIHLDLSDPAERRWHEANPLGLLEQDEAWSASPGDEVAGDEVVAVESRSDTAKELRLASGSTVHVTRRSVADPDIDPPTSPPVVPLRDVERLLPG